MVVAWEAVAVRGVATVLATAARRFSNSVRDKTA
jgi:hypothetical protein